MQLLIKKNVIKIHCSASFIVMLLHRNYTNEQLHYIQPFLIAAIKTRTGVRISGYEIKGGERGWFYITRTDTKQQLYNIADTLGEQHEKRN